ncbi:glycosyltransferase [Fodinibius sp. SL11]|uniref:glycosyltransferase n=1 Tax=Fodinibius sp. SL11 TaxID=3425690 RepID=UPI003F883095
MNIIYHFTNIPSHYRKVLWERLVASDKFRVDFFFGDGPLGIKLIDFSEKPLCKFQDRFHFLKNIWFKKSIIWQSRVLKKCINDKIDTAIFLGNAYCITNWLAAFICKIRNIEVVFWGHGIYGNENSLKLFLRKTFLRLADKLLLYERRAKQLLVSEGFNSDKMYVVFNSLDYDTQKELREKFKGMDKNEVFESLKNPDLPVLIFIGRLTTIKEVDVLIESVNNINKEEININLVIIGDGPERERLERLSSKGVEEKWIHFVGECYEEEKIAQYLSAADLCVSPGNVGLTGIHSLTYGTPVATHDDMANQMPEAEVIKDGYNGFLFKKGSVEDLKREIEYWFKRDLDEIQLYSQCIEVIDKYYNPDYQLTVFERMVENKPPRV